MSCCKLPPMLGSECKNQNKPITIRGKVFEITEYKKSFDLTLSEDGRIIINILGKRPDWLQVGQEIEIAGGALQLVGENHTPNPL